MTTNERAMAAAASISENNATNAERLAKAIATAKAITDKQYEDDDVQLRPGSWV